MPRIKQSERSFGPAETTVRMRRGEVDGKVNGGEGGQP
jgi:hypothetical protein